MLNAASQYASTLKFCRSYTVQCKSTLSKGASIGREIAAVQIEPSPCEDAAIGVYYALNHITLGQLVSNCILKTDSILAFVVWFIVGTVIMVILHVIIHKILLPGSNLQEEIVHDGNWGAAIVYGIIPLGVTVYINTFLPYTCENMT